MKLFFRIVLVCSVIIIYPCFNAQARKVKYSLKTSVPQNEKDENVYAPGSQAISTFCEACGGSYTLNDVVFAGYDKKRLSNKESFFVTNKSDRLLTGFSLYIIYKDINGNQLHKVFVKKNCSIPAGETQKVDIPSWDTQHSFYYEKSELNPKKGDPYSVIFDPVTIYLQYPTQ